MGYYAWVAIRFYRRELYHFFLKRKAEKTGTVDLLQSDDVEKSMANQYIYSDSNLDESTERAFEQVEQLMSKIKILIAAGASKGYSKSDVLDEMAVLFRVYSLVNQEAFRGSINEFIVSECRLKGSLELTNDDVDELWGRIG
jgi:hypothetical protein